MHIGSSRLVRRLSAWLPVDAGPSRQDVAQRLGQWLGVPDAIALHGAHQAIRAVAHARPARRVRAADADLASALQKVRDTLAAAIMAPATGAPGRGRPAPAGVSPSLDADPGFGPWRQRCMDLQRQMELRIDALRAHARQVLSEASAPLAQLALLDAAMAQMLASQGPRLLSTLPDFLERRFDTLRAAHGALGDAPGQARSDPHAAWQAVFLQDWQDVMRAELELRLEPVTGLVEALARASGGQP